MNRMLLVAVVSAICVALIRSPASAQTSVKVASARSAKPLEIAPVDKPAATGTTRVAVINLGFVLTKYERANVLKEELQTEVKKLQEEAKKHMENINIWQAALQKNEFKIGTKEQYEEKLIAARRRLEDLNRTASTKFGKASQAQLVTLWSDVHEAVKAYAARHNIELVMAYGEPVQKDNLGAFQNLTRKISAADGGAALPFFMTPGVDISEAVTDLLNRRYREAKEKTDEPK